MQMKPCVWELVFTSLEKSSIAKIRLIKCLQCTISNHNNPDCIVKNIVSNVMIVKLKR